MRTFWIQTLGCKVNQYESEQLATLLRDRGLVATDSPESADLHVINTCSVTVQAASKSRQSVRRSTRLKVLDPSEISPKRTIVAGCWATSNRSEAMNMAGVDDVLTHSDDVAGRLDALLGEWGVPAPSVPLRRPGRGMTSLPLLGERQSGHQRAFLKIQDGCDAHCTYCIIPSLRPALWSKPVDEVVEEARALVDNGHVELVLTGIFLGAYGQPTALRRRQPAGVNPLGDLIDALCTRVQGLRRLRLSSLEPGDLTGELLRIMRSHPQVVPHFHLPVQSGSDAILHRMNRQYTRDDFLRMIDDVNASFDRPAITTDIIVGFPGETDAEFRQTLDVVERTKFIHIHAFSFSPRPGTAAARWGAEFVHGPVVNERINLLTERAAVHSLQFRRQFVGETVELLVERARSFDTLRHGRCERYFDVHFDDPHASTGDAVRVVIDRVTLTRTFARHSNREG